MIVVGVDTHKHEHLARALDELGQIHSEITLPASMAGYERFSAWLVELDGRRGESGHRESRQLRRRALRVPALRRV